YRAAAEQPVVARQPARKGELSEDYTTEMARQLMVDRYGAEAYTRGFRVYTTLLTAHQEAALQALRNGVLGYDRRHGQRGHE
ncbi:penicillin-binding protein, partial [Pelomicrobium sp. G1]